MIVADFNICFHTLLSETSLHYVRSCLHFRGGVTKKNKKKWDNIRIGEGGFKNPKYLNFNLGILKTEWGLYFQKCQN